jgi:hypothetical protein
MAVFSVIVFSGMFAMNKALLKSLLASVAILASTLCWSSCPDGYYSGPFGTCIPNSGTVIHPTPQTPPVVIPPPPPLPPGVPAPPPPAAVLQNVARGVQSDPLRLVIDPGSFILPTGLPQPGDFAEYVFRNPDKAVELLRNPQEQQYVLVANSMISSRDAALRSGAWRVPADVANFLQRWYPSDLIASVRWTTHYSAIQNTLQAGLFAVTDRGAVTLINVIVFKDANQAQDLSTWAHEFVHVQQYKQWGVFTFAQKWLNDTSESGEVEAPAYARQDEARDVLDLSDYAPPTVAVPQSVGTQGGQPYPSYPVPVPDGQQIGRPPSR